MSTKSLFYKLGGKYVVVVSDLEAYKPWIVVLIQNPGEIILNRPAQTGVFIYNETLITEGSRKGLSTWGYSLSYGGYGMYEYDPDVKRAVDNVISELISNEREVLREQFHYRCTGENGVPLDELQEDYADLISTLVYYTDNQRNSRKVDVKEHTTNAATEFKRQYIKTYIRTFIEYFTTLNGRLDDMDEAQLDEYIELLPINLKGE